MATCTTTFEKPLLEAQAGLDAVEHSLREAMRGAQGRDEAVVAWLGAEVVELLERCEALRLELRGLGSRLHGFA